ncbi:succinylglutamate desuccinylase/aspartoacylase family protein [candidate division KSB1 bacterium]
MEHDELIIAGKRVHPESRMEIPLQISDFFTSNPVRIPVVVINGAYPGPKVFVTAAIHGDEINGVEIVRRLISFISPEKLKGTLLCVPIVNLFGFYTMTRYLPDGRDLNRAFPGSSKGTGASRIADILFNSIVKVCDYGIDIHSPRVKRYEIPHAEADLSNRVAHQLARSFSTPVIINMRGNENSLQYTADSAGIPTIVLSGGEVLRFNEEVSVCGLNGILNVLAYLEMYDWEIKKSAYSIIVQEGRSLQTKRGGILYMKAQAGDLVYADDLVAEVLSPFGRTVEKITAPENGLLISVSTNPLVNPGNEACSYVHLDKSLHLVEEAHNIRKENGNAT